MNDEKDTVSLTEEEVKTIPVESVPAVEEAPAEVEIVGVGFRTAGKTYYFSPKQFQLAVGTPVIVETARGVEMGKITIANRMISTKEVVSPLRDIIRPASAADVSRYEENKRLEERAAEICKQKIRDHKLEMNLVSVEYTFDNSKLLFYFTAENRVDFRELVKDLASVFRTRIELRQIGIRDEAKLMGGFGVCARPFCCSSFLADFVQVSIKMAKEQNFSLNSAKISGACGRLMCCLRYEHDVYEEAIKQTPTVGSYVSTSGGLGVVTEARPLAGTVKVKLDDKAEAPRLYAVADIKVLRSKGKAGLQPEPDAQLVEEEIDPALLAEEDAATATSAAEEKPKRNERGEGKGQGRPNRQRPQHKKEQKNNPAGNGEQENRQSKAHNNHRNFKNRRPRREGGNQEPAKKRQEGNNGEN